MFFHRIALSFDVKVWGRLCSLIKLGMEMEWTWACGLKRMVWQTDHLEFNKKRWSSGKGMCSILAGKSPAATVEASGLAHYLIHS